MARFNWNLGKTTKLMKSITGYRHCQFLQGDSDSGTVFARGGVYVDMDYTCVAHWTPFDGLDFHCGACASNVHGSVK
jgi:hypothetical protein